MVFDTINLNRCFSADSHSCTIFQPLGGTPLKQYCIEKGYVDADFNVDNLYEPSLEMSSLTKEEIKGLYKTFQIYLKCDEFEFHDVQKAEKDNVVSANSTGLEGHNGGPPIEDQPDSLSSEQDAKPDPTGPQLKKSPSPSNTILPPLSLL